MQLQLLIMMRRFLRYNLGTTIWSVDLFPWMASWVCDRPKKLLASISTHLCMDIDTSEYMEIFSNIHCNSCASGVCFHGVTTEKWGENAEKFVKSCAADWLRNYLTLDDVSALNFVISFLLVISTFYCFSWKIEEFRTFTWFPSRDLLKISSQLSP